MIQKGSGEKTKEDALKNLRAKSIGEIRNSGVLQQDIEKQLDNSKKNGEQK